MNVSEITMEMIKYSNGNLHATVGTKRAGLCNIEKTKFQVKKEGANTITIIHQVPEKVQEVLYKTLQKNERAHHNK